MSAAKLLRCVLIHSAPRSGANIGLGSKATAWMPSQWCNVAVSQLSSASELSTTTAVVLARRLPGQMRVASCCAPEDWAICQQGRHSNQASAQRSGSDQRMYISTVPGHALLALYRARRLVPGLPSARLVGSSTSCSPSLSRGCVLFRIKARQELSQRDAGQAQPTRRLPGYLQV